MTVAVIGQITRDLVLRCAEPPDEGGSTTVVERREMLGGKGANQAVGLAQLGVSCALVGVAGDDPQGPAVLREAVADGIDVRGVHRRGATALMVDVVDERGGRRLFEDVPAAAMLTVEDLDRAAGVLDGAGTVSLQLQQPGATVLEAARRAHRRGAKVVADGHPDPGVADELLSLLGLLRVDAAEAALFAGRPVTTVDEATALAHRLLHQGPELVALAVADAGDLLVWKDGRHLFGHADVPVVDRTGAGDAFMAGLIAATRAGADPVQAGRLATAAAGSTVQRLGGRPDLSGLRAHEVLSKESK
jgi:ribokinase